MAQVLCCRLLLWNGDAFFERFAPFWPTDKFEIQLADHERTGVGDAATSDGSLALLVIAQQSSSHTVPPGASWNSWQITPVDRFVRGFNSTAAKRSSLFDCSPASIATGRAIKAVVGRPTLQFSAEKP